MARGNSDWIDAMRDQDGGGGEGMLMLATAVGVGVMAYHAALKPLSLKMMTRKWERQWTRENPYDRHTDYLEWAARRDEYITSAGSVIEEKANGRAAFAACIVGFFGSIALHVFFG